MLYESFVHPLTILSTLPSAGVGAVLALLLFRTQFDIIGMIGVILLIGIVKKNAILMIDFALDAERKLGLPPTEAIYEACLLRFRPIMMTTMASLLGAVPLIIGMGEGRRVPPAARHHDHRRIGPQSDPDPLHHTRRLFVSRSLSALEQAGVAGPLIAGAVHRCAGRLLDLLWAPGGRCFAAQRRIARLQALADHPAIAFQFAARCSAPRRDAAYIV